MSKRIQSPARLENAKLVEGGLTTHRKWVGESDGSRMSILLWLLLLGFVTVVLSVRSTIVRKHISSMQAELRELHRTVRGIVYRELGFDGRNEEEE